MPQSNWCWMKIIDINKTLQNLLHLRIQIYQLERHLNNLEYFYQFILLFTSCNWEKQKEEEEFHWLLVPRLFSHIHTSHNFSWMNFWGVEEFPLRITHNRWIDEKEKKFIHKNKALSWMNKLMDVNVSVKGQN